jgi:predicted nucleic acid-binding protein
MRAILDSGFLYALADADDSWHSEALAIAQTHQHAELILPIPVLPETLYLIGSRLGHDKMRNFLRELLSWEVQIEPIDKIDLQRTLVILDQYADAHLDFVDATIIALAERLDITHVFTVDRRDFSLVRPKHCNAFTILP